LLQGNYIATALFHLCIQVCGEVDFKVTVSDELMSLVIILKHQSAVSFEKYPFVNNKLLMMARPLHSLRPALH
jgi:hypothetical protein